MKVYFGDSSSDSSSVTMFLTNKAMQLLENNILYVCSSLFITPVLPLDSLFTVKNEIVQNTAVVFYDWREINENSNIKAAKWERRHDLPFKELFIAEEKYRYVDNDFICN